VKIIDPNTGLTVPRGTPGELCTRGYSVMLGYWGQPDQTAEVIDQARWMHTGDVAVMDPEGYLNITGRIKDMVIRGGENVYPREIEEFLYTHPDILDAQVIGVPDARHGEELCAWVRLRPGAPELTADALRDYSTGKLAHYKIPRYVHVVHEFPMTVTGKVRKVEMRERSVQLPGWAPSPPPSTPDPAEPGRRHGCLSARHGKRPQPKHGGRSLVKGAAPVRCQLRIRSPCRRRRACRRPPVPGSSPACQRSRLPW
jgi:AMP-binding enzyme